MSYAAVTKENREPLSEQPHPDTGLLNTEPAGTDVTLPDGDSTKVTIAPADFKEHPRVAANIVTEQVEQKKQDLKDSMASHNNSSSKPTGSTRDARKQKARETFDEAEEEAKDFFEKAKHTLLQPGVAGGIFGIVNLGLIGTLGYKLYTEPGLRTDQRFLTTTAVSALALLGGEGYYAEAYRKTDAGQREEAKAREEGAALYNHAKTIVLRPGVLGGIVGVLNVGILGGVGYWSYVNWDAPHKWDRRTVSSASVALLALFAGEGYLGEQYKEKEYPKHK